MEPMLIVDGELKSLQIIPRELNKFMSSQDWQASKRIPQGDQGQK